jgi:hypothetical protein
VSTLEHTLTRSTPQRVSRDDDNADSIFTIKNLAGVKNFASTAFVGTDFAGSGVAGSSSSDSRADTFSLLSSMLTNVLLNLHVLFARYKEVDEGNCEHFITTLKDVGDDGSLCEKEFIGQVMSAFASSGSSWKRLPSTSIYPISYFHVPAFQST